MPTAHSRYTSVAIVFNPDKPRAREQSQKLAHWFKQHKLQVQVSTKVTAAMKTANMVVALGGDGTVLQVARDVSDWNIPVMGVNVGRLGFLAATETGAATRTLQRVISGEGRIEPRTLIEATVYAKGKRAMTYLGLNDAVLRSGATGRVLWLESRVRDRVLASYAGDGLIISTPTGSTAYNLAASGPILYPDLDVLLMTPICPHSLSQRPLVLPAYEVIEVSVLKPSPETILSLDGRLSQTLSPGDRVEIRRSMKQAQLLMDPDRTFYQVLQNKLKWGGQ